MSLFSDWIYAVKVCRKYKLRWNFMCGLSRANITQYCYNIHRPLISINLFHKGFIDAFMHEVGHHVLAKGGRVERIQLATRWNAACLSGKPYLSLLTEEALASRFSRKALGKKSNIQELTKWFNTYSASGYNLKAREYITVQEVTDHVYKCTRSIQK